MNRKVILKLLPLLLLTALLSGCNRQPKYVIGASLAGAGDWSAKLYDEIKTACYLRPNVTLDFRSAGEDNKLQEEQIDSMINAHVDLIIISPGIFRDDSRMLQRAKAAGIPVIVVDRQTNSPDYTAYIGRNDEQLGRMIGNYLGQARRGKPTAILEVSGSPGSSPSIDRSRGFRQAIAKYPNLHIVATVGETWKQDSVTERGKEFLRRHPNLKFDCVVGQSDNCAMSMRKAIEQVGGHPIVTYYGIDGLPGPKGGLQMVKDGKMEATVINPTRGFQVVALAMHILSGSPYKRINLLHTAVVDKTNIGVVMNQQELINDQEKQLKKQNNMLLHFYEQHKHQQVYLLLNVIIVLLIAFSLYLYHHMTVLSRQQVFKLVTLHLQHYMQVQALQGRLTMSDADEYDNAESHFMSVLFETILKHINDTSLNTNTIAEEMGISPQKLTATLKGITNTTVDQAIAITRKFVALNKVKTNFV